MESAPRDTHPSNKLHWALYRLKQVPRALYCKFSSTVKCLGFKSSHNGHPLFVQNIFHWYILLPLYVNNMVITIGDDTDITKLQQYFSQRFKMKDLEQLDCFLGLEVASNYSVYYQVGFTNNKIAPTLIKTSAKFDEKEENPFPNSTIYRYLVGILVYHHVTCPDIIYIVHIVN